jgi:hypothetical protein
MSTVYIIHYVCMYEYVKYSALQFSASDFLAVGVRRRWNPGKEIDYFYYQTDHISH